MKIHMQCLAEKYLIIKIFYRLNEQRTIHNPLAVGPSDRRVERLLKTINLQPSLSTSLGTASVSSAFLSKAGKASLVFQYNRCLIEVRILLTFFKKLNFLTLFLFLQLLTRFGNSRHCCSSCR